jgi:hypothetical protein
MRGVDQSNEYEQLCEMLAQAGFDPERCHGAAMILAGRGEEVGEDQLESEANPHITTPNGPTKYSTTKQAPQYAGAGQPYDPVGNARSGVPTEATDSPNGLEGMPRPGGGMQGGFNNRKTNEGWNSARTINTGARDAALKAAGRIASDSSVGTYEQTADKGGAWQESVWAMQRRQQGKQPHYRTVSKNPKVAQDKAPTNDMGAFLKRHPYLQNLGQC